MLRTVVAGAGLGSLLLIRSGRKLQAQQERQEYMAAPLSDLTIGQEKMRARMERIIMGLQGELCRALQGVEKEQQFRVDRWTREEGGGGVTCVVQDGAVFEKAGVGVSVVHGMIPPTAVAQMNARGKQLPEGQEMPFFACGISSVIHPRNPHVPTLHFNYRYFEVEESPGKTRWWFGGGCVSFKIDRSSNVQVFLQDLTPYYLDEGDASHFHRTLKTACDKHNTKYYSKFKAWCDDYFRIKHRNISRGVGGIFFDDLDSPDAEQCFQFVRSCGNAVIPSYLPTVMKNKDKDYGDSERQWQLVRRGHYAEFNLVYDRSVVSLYLSSVS